MFLAFCVDLGDGSLWNSTSFVPEIPSNSVHLNVDTSSCAHIPIHYVPLTPTDPIDPLQISPLDPSSDLSGDSVIYTPLDTVTNNIGTSSDLVPHAHDWSSGAADSNVNYVGSSSIWTEQYMDGWIFSKSAETMIRADCATLIPACGCPANSTSKQDQLAGKPPIPPHSAPIP